MKRIVVLCSLIVIVMLGLVRPGVVQASANITIISLSCNSFDNTVTVSASVTGGGANLFIAFNHDITLNNEDFAGHIGNSGNNQPSGTFTVTDSRATNGTVVSVTKQGTELASATCSPSSEITWCDLSDDGRLDGLCGDRIVVYCNDDEEPANLDVFVIDNQGGGHELTTLSLDDLNAVDPGQYSKDLGANGVIFAGGTDDVYYVGLQGGPYGGTAKGDWLKANLPCDG